MGEGRDIYRPLTIIYVMFGDPTQSYSPLQLYHLKLPGISCQRKIPLPQLQAFIFYYWVLYIDAEQIDLEVIPDNAIDLVLSPEIDDFSALYFPSAEKYKIPLTGPAVYAGISFKAEKAADCLNFELAALKAFSPGQATTNSLMLSPLVNSIQGCSDTASITALFDHYWKQRLRQRLTMPVNGGASLNHERWVEAIHQSLGSGSLQKIATKLGLSERQFRRVSTRLFGLSPKKVQRVLRLQAAVSELFSADRLTIENHYFDDSHRIKELKKLTGLTPGNIRKMAEKYNLPD